jgi:ribosomal protein S18 acetylase RimI-like enzyme
MLDVVSYRPLSTCPIDDAVRAWNDGFADYYSDLTTTTDYFELRMRQDGIAAEASILAYAADRPVGIVLNAIADVHGIRQAWNGGTAVAADYRGTGVAREMLRRAIASYGEHKVQLATLEARSQNARAIALYAQFGYRSSGELHGLAARQPHLEAGSDGATVEFVAPERLSSVPFYRTRANWLTLWPNAVGASAVIATRGGAPSAYVLYRRMQPAKSAGPSIRLLQAECSDDEPALRSALAALFAHHREVPEYLAYNIPATNRRGLTVLREAGFEPAWDQIWMTREFVI